VEELPSLEPFGLCLFVCVGQQVNNSLEELDLDRNELTDDFTADDNFIHLGKLRRLNLADQRFSEKGIAAISLLIQVLFFAPRDYPVEFVFLPSEAVLLSHWA